MEKRKKVKKFLLAIPLGTLWCLIGSIFNILFWTATRYPYIFPYETFIVEGYFMVMAVYYFHEATNGIWKNYLELAFLLVFCIWEIWFIYMDRQGLDNIVDFGYKFMPICLVAMLVSFFLYKYKQKQKAKQQCRLIRINKSVFTVLIGFWSYLGATLIGDSAFSFFLMLIILPIFVVIYVVIAQKILKKEYRWKLFCAYIVVFVILFLKVCLMSMLGIDIYGYCELGDFLMPAIPYGIAVAIGELIVCLSDKRNDSKLVKLEEKNIESDRGWQVNRIEKKSKLLPIVISIPISMLGYLIYYIVCKTAVPAFFALVLLNENYDYMYMDIYAMVFVWIVLIAESYCMIMILTRFHKVTNGMAVGYLESCLFLWIFGILGQTIISGQKLKLSTVFLLESDIYIAKDIRMLLLWLIVLGLSSLLYKIGQKRKIKEFKWKISKKILLFLLICLSCMILIWMAFHIWMVLTLQPISG
ncbi:MAG: hypothetical protein NC412_01285 [Roseburia sp.]|nr:hypothetical protein [Roseburia sp.]MCM1277761.1 hypothetical protein [Robinsoniella sp.]